MIQDPEVRDYLAKVATAQLPAFYTMTPPEARQVYRDRRTLMEPPSPEIGSITEDFALGGGPDIRIPLRIYRPLGSRLGEVLPVLVYFHGGGWTIGDLETHDTLCRELANKTPCCVIAVDYRLAPEHRFPAALDDCWAAVQWIYHQAEKLGIDPQRIAVGGDSAGGNLAAVVTIMSREQKGPKLVFQLLIYPATDQHLKYPSHVRNGKGYVLTHDLVVYFRDNYLDAKDFDDWRASPLLAKDLSGLAPAMMIAAGLDPLIDEDKFYADRLIESGVPVVYKYYEEMIHGFIRMGGVFETARQAVDDAAQELAKAFVKRS